MLTPPEWRRVARGEPEDLPPWCDPEAEEALSPLSPAGLWLADGLGFYLAECAARVSPDARWTVYHAPSRRLHDAEENKPVLTTPAGTWNPHDVAYGLLLRAFSDDRDEPERAVRVYRYGLAALGAGPLPS